MRSKDENPIEPVSLFEEDTPGGLKYRGKVLQVHREKVAISKPRGETNPPAPWSWTPILQNCEKINFCFQATQSMVLYYGIPGKLKRESTDFKFERMESWGVGGTKT